MEEHKIQCPNIGMIEVALQTTKPHLNSFVIMTVHDLGCNANQYNKFIFHQKMEPIKKRSTFLNISLPGQSSNAPDLPNNYQFPSMQLIASDLIHVLNKLNIKEVVLFGEGAGANILSRFAILYPERVLGVCLLHATGTAANFIDSIKDKLLSWKLDLGGKNPSLEHYLAIHRYGHTENTNEEEIKKIIINFQEEMRKNINYKNLMCFIDSFLKRNSIIEDAKMIKCPTLLITGQHSLFHISTRNLFQSVAKGNEDKAKVEFIEIPNVSNVLEEKPEKLAESFQYFLQGLGLVSSVPMHNVHKMLKNRTMSMEDYDKPHQNVYFSKGPSLDVENNNNNIDNNNK